MCQKSLGWILNKLKHALKLLASKFHAIRQSHSGRQAVDACRVTRNIADRVTVNSDSGGIVFLVRVLHNDQLVTSWAPHLNLANADIFQLYIGGFEIRNKIKLAAISIKE